MAQSNLFQDWDSDASLTVQARSYEIPQSQLIPPDLADLQIQRLDENTAENYSFVNCGNSPSLHYSPGPSHWRETGKNDYSEDSDFQQSFGSYDNQYIENGGHSASGVQEGFQNYQQFNQPPMSNSFIQSQEDHRFMSQQQPCGSNYNYEYGLAEQNYSDLRGVHAGELSQLASGNASAPSPVPPAYRMEDQECHQEQSLTASGKPRKRRPKTSLLNMTEEERKAHERNINRPAQARYRSKKAQQQQDLLLQLERETVRHEDLQAQLQQITSRIDQFRVADAM